MGVTACLDDCPSLKTRDSVILVPAPCWLIHALDLVNMFWHFAQAPRVGEVYNAGGGRAIHCSMLESIRLCQELSGRELKTKYSETHRIGDHIWYVSDIGKFRRHYPDWDFEYDLDQILEEIRSGWEERL